MNSIVILSDTLAIRADQVVAVKAGVSRTEVQMESGVVWLVSMTVKDAATEINFALRKRHCAGSLKQFAEKPMSSADKISDAEVATLCSEWPNWLHGAVTEATELADEKDWSTEQVVGYAILATGRAQSAVVGDDRIEQAYKAGFDFAMLTRGKE